MIHKPIWVLVGCLALAPLFAPTVWAANTGIAIAPDKTGSFEFIEDFQTPKFLQEAFVTGFRSECWSPGSITNHGPQSWSLIYRFHGTNDIGSNVATGIYIYSLSSGAYHSTKKMLYLK